MHLAEWRWWRFSPPWTRGTRTWSTMPRWISMALALPPAPGAALLQLCSFLFFSSSDRSVRIFDVKDGTQSLAASLVGHEGPVWQVAWAHPRWTKPKWQNKSTKIKFSTGLETFWPPAPMTEESWYGRRIRASGQRWSCWMNNQHIAKSAGSGVLKSKYMNSTPWLLNWLLIFAKWNIAQCSAFSGIFVLFGTDSCWYVH